MATFSAALKHKISDQYDIVLDEVAEGLAPDKYREQVGYLRGLREVIKMCEELEKEHG